MEHRNHNQQAIEKVPTRIGPALGVLLEAIDYAQQTSGDCWEFAVELNQLTALGLTSNDFRWLVRKGLVEHQREVTLDNDNGRAFRPNGDLTFPAATCFILTAAGIAVANGSSPAAAAASTSSHPVAEHVSVTANHNLSDKPMVPTWDSERRALRINGMMVKRFKSTAANQETILTAFEEESWPHRIDDPLSPQPNQDTKRRLADTIKGLNRKQKHALIRFHGDGTGEGVTWELVGRDGSGDGLLG
jgi:hypothetical protein